MAVPPGRLVWSTPTWDAEFRSSLGFRVLTRWEHLARLQPREIALDPAVRAGKLNLMSTARSSTCQGLVLFDPSCVEPVGDVSWVRHDLACPSNEMLMMTDGQGTPLVHSELFTVALPALT